MKINGSVALVTGGNRGIGEHFVRALLDAGAAKVYAAARDPRKVDRARRGPDPRGHHRPRLGARRRGTGRRRHPAGQQRGHLHRRERAGGRTLRLAAGVRHPCARDAGHEPGLRARPRRQWRRRHPQRALGAVLVLLPRERRLQRREVRRVVADQRAARPTRRAGHAGDRAARRLRRHGPDRGRHGAQVRARRRRPGPPSRASRRASSRSRPTTRAGRSRRRCPWVRPPSTPNWPPPGADPRARPPRLTRGRSPAAAARSR